MSFILTNTPREFVPKSQENTENPLTFICSPPSRKTTLDIQEKIMKSVNTDEEIDSLDLPIADLMELSLESCVVGWKNVNDADGNPVLFSKEAFSSFNDTVILIELYTYIKELTESTEKN